MNICLDCGGDYSYDPNKPLGASSSRCSKCRKRDTIKQKKIALLMIAGHGVLQCRKCGYSRCTSALLLKDAVGFMNEVSSQEEKEIRARSQFILCLNCDAEIESNEVESKVTNSKSYPVEVEFYSREVRVVSTKIEPVVSYHHEYSDVEIVKSEDGGEAKRVSPTKTRFIGTQKTDMPVVQVD